MADLFEDPSFAAENVASLAVCGHRCLVFDRDSPLKSGFVKQNDIAPNLSTAVATISALLFLFIRSLSSS